MCGMTFRLYVEFGEGLVIEVEGDNDVQVRNLFDDACEKILKDSDPDIIAHKIGSGKQDLPSSG